jgi:malonate decarboxylase epsilon subunit
VSRENALAALFPGQGSQRPGMLAALRADATCAAVLDEAGAVLGCDPLQLDTEDALTGTHAAQIALLIAGVASARMLERHEIVPNYVAGHSVGAFAAAVHAHVLDFAAALRLVDLRGQEMGREFPRGYGMAAIAGVPEMVVRRWIDQAVARGATLFLANRNAERQFTISGAERDLDELMAQARQHGASAAVRLAVPVPSHSPLMSAVADRLRAALQSVQLRTARFPFGANRSARLLTDSNAIANDLAEGVAHPVRWHEITTALHERGVGLFLEMAPGDTLTLLAQSAFPDSRAVAVENVGIAGLRALQRR